MSNRSIDILSLFYLIVFSITCFIFYKETALTLDGGQQLYQLINVGEFNLFFSRIGSLYHQVPALIARAMGASLNTIVLVHAMTFPIVCVLLWVFTRFIARSHSASLLILLSSCVGLSGAFMIKQWTVFWVIPYFILFYILLEKRSLALFKWQHYIMATVLFFLMLTTHPTGLLGALFLLFFMLIYQKSFSLRHILYWTGCLLFSFTLKQILLPSDYESIKYLDVLKGMMYFPLWIWFRLIPYFILNGFVYVFPTIMISLISFYLFKKNKQSFLVFIFCCIGLLIVDLGLLFVTPVRPDTLFYYEGTILASVNFVSAIFLFLWMKEVVPFKLALLTVFLSLFYSSIIIYGELSKQQKFYNNLAHSLYNCSKALSTDIFITDLTTLSDLDERKQMYWHMEWNTLLLTACTFDHPIVLFPTNDTAIHRTDTSIYYVYMDDLNEYPSGHEIPVRAKLKPEMFSDNWIVPTLNVKNRTKVATYFNHNCN